MPQTTPEQSVDVHGDRERTATRLLQSSARTSFDPNVELDWDAPFHDDKFFLPERRCSLYGTPIWDRLSRVQRIELSKHELANVLQVAIWGELVLIQMLVRHAYDRDYQSAHVRYALTEIADECRHSSMFSRMLVKLGCPTYDVRPINRWFGKLFKTTSNDTLSFIAALWIEELTDKAQRETMRDDTVQPLVREMFRIHVIEEARHIRYGEEEGARQWQAMCRRPRSFASRAWTRFATGAAAATYISAFLQPQVYAAVGLDPREAVRTALASPHNRQSLAGLAEQAMKYCAVHGLDRFPATLWWRALGLMRWEQN